MLIRYQTWIFFCLVVLLSSMADSKYTISQLKIQLQRDVKIIGNEMLKIYEERCNIINQGDCETLSYNQCVGTPPKKCIDGFFYDKSKCQCGYFSDTSSIRFPWKVNLNKMTYNERQFVCLSAKLEKTLKEKNQKYRGIIQRNFFGSYTRGFRVYPSVTGPNIKGNCTQDYNIFNRLWFSAPVTNQRHIVFLIDNTLSMQSWWNYIVNSVSNTINNTLTQYDSLEIVLLNQEPSALNLPSDHKATNVYQEDIKKGLLNVERNKGTTRNYEKGFQECLNSLGKMYKTQTDKAENVIIVITNDSNNNESKSIKDLINNSITKNLSIFIYNLLLNDLENQFLSDIAFTYRGTYQIIRDRQTLDSVLPEYYLPLTIGYMNTEVYWIEPFTNIKTNEENFAVSYPVYYPVKYTYNNANFEQNRLLGVVCMTVPIRALSQPNDRMDKTYSQSDIRDQIVKDNKRKMDRNNSDCQLQQIRKNKKGKSFSPDLNCQYKPPCLKSFTASDIFYSSFQAVDNYTNLCHSPSTQKNSVSSILIALIIAVAILSSIIFAIIVVKFYHLRLKKVENQQKVIVKQDEFKQQCNPRSENQLRI